jgi:hypothetical protein
VSMSVDDIVQWNTGTVNATPVTCTLPAGTTEGNTVILCVGTVGSGSPASTGFTRDHGTVGGTMRPYVLRKADVPAGESSWALLGFSGAQPTIWFAFEIAGFHPQAPKEVNVPSPELGFAVTSQTTGTTPASTAYEGLELAFWFGQNTANATVPVWSGFTNGVVEYAQTSRTDGATAMAGCVGFRPIVDTGMYESTATSSVTVDAGAVLVAYAAAQARRVPNLDVMTGLEFGTTAGWATGNAGNPPFDVVSGGATVVSSTPKTGSYCLQLSSSSAAANVAWTSSGALVNYTQPTGMVDRRYYAGRLSFRFPTSLPGVDLNLCALDTGSDSTGEGLYVFYRTATQKVGVAVRQTSFGFGTEIASDITLAADTWYDLDLLFDGANAYRQQEWRGFWQLNGVEQALATKTTNTASAVTAITQFRLGWQASITATVLYDDVAGSKHPGHHPLGEIRIYPLKVDPAATPTVTNATAFSTFTNNGTINATFSTTTARNAVDDIPPTIGGSADGFVQDTIGASDYVELPMQTRDVATNLEALRGIRWYFPGWAVDATAATIGFRAYDGTDETVLFAAADPNFDASTTAPAWVSKMHRTQGSNVPFLWSQARVDGLAARVGFSGDATPAIGVHAVLAELAVRTAFSQQVVEADGVFVYSLLDPDTGNVIALRLVAPGDGSATADYVINGTPVSRNAAAGTEDLYVVGAETNDVVSFISAVRD